MADRFAVASASGSGAAKQVPFIVDSGTVYMESAFIRDASITTAKIDDAAITSAKIDSAAITSAKIDDLAVERLKLADASVSSFERAYTAGTISLGNTGSSATWINIQQLSYTIGRAGPQVIFVSVYGEPGSDFELRIIRTNGGSSSTIFSQDGYVATGSGKRFDFLVIDAESLSGSVTYGLEGRYEGNGASVSQRFLGVLNVAK